MGLSYELLLQKQARIPFFLVRALCLRALEVTGDEHFGLHLAQYDIGVLVLLASEICGAPIRPRVVRFRYRAPERIDEHRKVFDCPIEFEARNNQLVVEHEALRTPMLHANAAFLSVFERQLDDVLARLSPAARTSDAVRAVAQSALRLGGTDLARTARLLSTSERTLQRRLQEEGTSFAEILDSARREMALAYLTCGLPLPEIADLLGYSDITAFCHAFRRWTGRPPSEFVATVD